VVCHQKRKDWLIICVPLPIRKVAVFLVYGVNDDATMFSVSKEQADEIIRTLGNIARNNLMQPLILEHATVDFNGNSLLFIHIPENVEKPVYMRGGTIYDSYRRSVGQTVKMSHQEVKQLIATSQGLLFHEQTALSKKWLRDTKK
jgi:predicted HTH transcriptional regulator